MSGELEAAGALTTAGLAAGAIEGREAHAPGEGACLNCDAQITGSYCAQCGQPAHAHRSLWHMLEEALHGIIHFDTKAWRTLPLLAFRPGTLTRNYIYGKRARYISPLALFLFTIFLMFFVFAFVDVNVFEPRVGGQGQVAREISADLETDLAEARTEQRAAEQALERLQAARGAAVPTPEQRLAEEAAARDASIARATVQRLESALSRIEAPEQAPAGETSADAAQAGNETTADGPVEAEGDGTWQQAVSEAARNGEIRIGTPFPEFNARVLHSLENPDLALYKVQQAAYKLSFLLVPISLPFIWLLFLWRRGLTLYDHAVFTLYSLSFASLVFVVVALVNDVPWLEWGGAALLLVGMPVHMYFHVKGAYALGWWSALWRTSFLIVFALVALTLFLVLIFLFGLGG